MPVPTDPRTPQQRISDQLKAARRQLTSGSLSRSQRGEVADRIHELEKEAEQVGI
ncbi:hypothetical protein ABT173_10230 [Streptomyces sp. NPDC001795]|uniref:hypothetical protein n=1 Tax=Streptomyces sp. NPDC001795 TaxID=3154525 RepID=UPI003325A330